jgi:DnaJ-class molecular chaperone
MTGRVHCPNCAGDIFSLSDAGKCAHCNGTGINTRINSPEPKCPYCRGTGVCASCRGTGYADDWDNGGKIQTLFGE